MTGPAPRPVDPVLDALDRLDWERIEIALTWIPSPYRDPVRKDLATVREALERLREERDAYKADRDSYDDLLGRKMDERDVWHKRAESAEATEGLREISRIAVNGDDHAIPDPLARLDAIESVARALLSANPPQGDTAAFCEHGYTTEDSAHPSAGLERCPTCSPSDGGGAPTVAKLQQTVEAARLTVKPGDYHDVCPLCGIHRQNAGFLKETCGDGYLKPDCFVVRLDGAR